MKIGLAGAPGAGKSDIARHLARLLETEGKYLPVAVVDDYVPEVEDAMDLGCGFVGSHIADAAIALTRFGRERQAARDGAQTIITCGTLAETAVYTALACEMRQNELSWAIASTAMPYYALLGRSMNYDVVFYRSLPVGSEDLPMILDADLGEAFKALDVPWYELRADVSAEEAAQGAFEFIKGAV